MTDLATQLIQECEGCRLTAYLDTRGLPTIGWGHLLDSSKDWTGYTITQERADQLLQADMGSARSYAALFPHFQDMNEVRQAVCVSMCYQLGSKPLHWPNFMAALGREDYAQAATAGRDSDWWRVQTPKRAEREMSMMETGLWIE
jgi:GH24 family phage-related lysozyme (muramidase)